jgi:hypothetical protein
MNLSGLALHIIIYVKASTMPFERPKGIDLQKCDDDGVRPESAAMSPMNYHKLSSPLVLRRLDFDLGQKVVGYNTQAFKCR